MTSEPKPRTIEKPLKQSSTASPTSDCATRNADALFTLARPEGSGRPRVRSTPASSLRSRMSL